VSEQKAAASAPPEGGSGSGGKPIILYALVVLNMLALGGVGAMLFLNKKNEAEHAKVIDKAIEPEHGAAAHGEAHGEGHGEGHDAKDGEHEQQDEFIGKTIPMETFLVNLSGSRGNKVLKVNMEFEFEGERIADEIDKRKPQIRDIIIIILSSKTYAQLTEAQGKEHLRDEIRDTVNSFLTKGKIKRVFFTEFIFN
jgi:flagellar protein FliL